MVSLLILCLFEVCIKINAVDVMASLLKMENLHCFWSLAAMNRVNFLL